MRENFDLRTAQSPTLCNFWSNNAFTEVVHALRERNKADNAVAVALERIHRDEQQIARCLGKSVRPLDILENPRNRRWTKDGTRSL